MYNQGQVSCFATAHYRRVKRSAADVSVLSAGIDNNAFGVLYYFINSENVDDGNAKGSTFLPSPEMQPMRLPFEPRYRFTILFHDKEAGFEWVYPRWVVPRS